MTIRPIKLPGDLVPLAEMVTESFRYPENEAWSVQTDEKEQIVSTMKNLSRIWPLIRLIQVVSPSLRDLIRGHVWLEEGQPAGVTIVQRRGATDTWVIGTVGVLPAFRRRGIARQLLQTSLESIRERDGKKAFLYVIDGNLPAIGLYEKLGFEHYSGDIIFHTELDTTPPAPKLPEGYVQSPLGPFDWQPRYELEKRISPASLLKYEPVEVGRFRQPAAMRLLLPLISFAQGVRDEDFIIRTANEEQVVARGGYTIPTRDKGPNNLRARLDPAYPKLAPYLMGYLLHQVATSSAGRRIEFPISTWMEPMAAAIAQAGFERRMKSLRMGLEL